MAHVNDINIIKRSKVLTRPDNIEDYVGRLFGTKVTGTAWEPAFVGADEMGRTVKILSTDTDAYIVVDYTSLNIYRPGDRQYNDTLCASLIDGHWSIDGGVDDIEAMYAISQAAGLYNDLYDLDGNTFDDDDDLVEMHDIQNRERYAIKYMADEMRRRGLDDCSDCAPAACDDGVISVTITGYTHTTDTVAGNSDAYVYDNGDSFDLIVDINDHLDRSSIEMLVDSALDDVIDTINDQIDNGDEDKPVS